ncbi:MAG: Rieske 2Fe-2S domain-containing protein, partial [Acidiferrobacteraceae bacterium]|nr:Rieske 2Fe-2S domain-containing protein [Acidiferrobacteraceae bacterium]
DTLMEIQPPKDWSTSHGGSMRRVVVSDDLRQHAAREAGERAATVKVPTPQSPMKTQALANTFDVVPKLDETWQRVCNISELSAGTLKRVEASGIELIVTNLGDCIRAFPPTCPHLAEPLVDSGLIKDGVLTCTKHLWQWDLRTGEMRGAAEQPVQMYDAVLNDQDVMVRIEQEITYDYDDEDDLGDDDFFGAD